MNQNLMPKAAQRIDVADVLRGLAVAGIVLIHSIEHFNFVSHPPTDSVWLQFANDSVWNSLFFMFAGKAYAVFALLFGFSFFIQYNNAQKRGIDFRGRFMWRLFLLFLWGQINASFFLGEVLVLYSLLGFIMPLFAKASNKTVLIVAAILMIQPMEWVRLIMAIANPDAPIPVSLDAPFWKVTSEVLRNGNFFEIVKVNLWEGQIASLAWAFENARFFQTPSLFLIGMVIGRVGLFKQSASNSRFWLSVLMISIFAFFPLNGLSAMFADYVKNPAIIKPAMLIITSLTKFAFMSFLVSIVIIAYYHLPKMKTFLNRIIPYGKMSLTNYVTQSIIGSALFYNWGLKLDLGSFHSVMLGILIFIVQFQFCKWWMRHHKHGPLEWIWKKATWIKL